MTKTPWCAVTATVEEIGGRWKPTILFHLKDRPRRFNDLRPLVPGITQRMLTQRWGMANGRRRRGSG